MRRFALLVAVTTGLLTAGCSEAPKADADAAVIESSDDQPAASASATPAAATEVVDAGPADRGTVPMEITAVVGGKSYRASGQGECTHTAAASIYQVPAAQWSARYPAPGDAELRSFNLTIWQPKAGGGDQASLAFQADGDLHRIATVAGGELVGRGTASVRSAGESGTLTVEGEDGDGTPVRVTVECSRFTVPVAEGG